MSNYDERFYCGIHACSVYAAREIFSILREILPPIHAAVDVGCGGGTWLAALRQQGVERILGIDGNWVPRKLLQIPHECFMERDLAQPLHLSERFDLAISLEVAEHLPPESAGGFVASLTELADFVLFSAAIPHQAGVDHVNLQWPDYWCALFRDRGYVVLDEIRGRIWNDASIPCWYKQNVLLYAKDSRVKELKLSYDPNRPPPLSIVHPSFFLETARIAAVVIRAWEWLPPPLKRWTARLVK